MNRKRRSFQMLEGPRNTGTLILGLLLCCAALLPTPGFGATYQVNQDGSGDSTTIQAAIDAAVNGDVIVVHPGTYYENIHFDGKNITLRSVDPEDEQVVASTIIDGGQNGSVVRFAGTEDERCQLSGFTITNGDSGKGGGGILGGDQWSDPPVCTLAEISNCTISGNSTGTWGGGGLAYCDGVISNCTITGNSVTGQFVSGGGLAGCDGEISNCVIEGNFSCGSYGHGGGLAWCHGTISNCVIEGNFCRGLYGRGGGLVACHGTISNCTITGNSAFWGGGLDSCNGPISNCTISSNSATGSFGGGGGALYACGGTITNCVVWGNDAPTHPELGDCGNAVITYSCIRDWAGGGEGNISDDPLFVEGPLGDYYLSCTAAGQAADSPCIDAGSGTAESVGLDKFTTRTDGVPDAGMVDIGYHYSPALDQNLRIECWLNESEFAPGDTLVGFIEAQNPGPDVPADVYVAFVLPNGVVVSLTAGGLANGIYPWVSNVLLPSGFHFGPSEVLRTTVPEGTGSYLFAAALSEPGQFEFIGTPSLFPFRITDSYRVGNEE